jgi:hypothetical protein
MSLYYIDDGSIAKLTNVRKEMRAAMHSATPYDISSVTLAPIERLMMKPGWWLPNDKFDEASWDHHVMMTVATASMMLTDTDCASVKEMAMQLLLYRGTELVSEKMSPDKKQKVASPMTETRLVMTSEPNDFVAANASRKRGPMFQLDSDLFAMQADNKTLSDDNEALIARNEHQGKVNKQQIVNAQKLHAQIATLEANEQSHKNKLFQAHQEKNIARAETLEWKKKFNDKVKEFNDLIAALP